MNGLYLKIADLIVKVSGDKLTEGILAMEGFKLYVEDTPSSTPIAEFVYVDDASIPPCFTKMTYNVTIDGYVHHSGHYAEGFLYEGISPKAEVLKIWKKDGDDKVYVYGNLNLRMLRFGLWLAFGLASYPYGVIAIHTSCIVWGDRSVIFLGESGTGKSTHTRMWREAIEGAHLLNDDSPMMRVMDDGKVYMYGSPWSGKTPCYRTERYELAACVRLSQAPYNKIRQLKLLHAYASLHPSCPPDFAYYEKIYDCISETLGKVLSCTPVYHLECLPDHDAARLSFNTVFNKAD